MLVKLENVKKDYSDFQLDCTLQLEEGRITGLIGQNGAGKTTAFKTILDLIKIDDGKVTVLGKDRSELTALDREEIGVVLSDSGFSDYLCANDILKIVKAMYKNFNEEDFQKYCSHFKLPMKKKLKEYSTGMKAKFKLLIALCHNAKLLILDEPTSGLDVVVRDEILDLLRDYMEQDSSRGILISSHISSDLESLCDDVYMIHDGKVIMHEDTDEILGNYGVIKVDPKSYENLDFKHVVKVKKEHYGYTCLTNQKQYYMTKYPELVVEKGNLDEVITILIKGEAKCTA